MTRLRKGIALVSELDTYLKGAWSRTMSIFHVAFEGDRRRLVYEQHDCHEFMNSCTRRSCSPQLSLKNSFTINVLGRYSIAPIAIISQKTPTLLSSCGATDAPNE